jgi:hypothetical protein
MQEIEKKMNALLNQPAKRRLIDFTPMLVLVSIMLASFTASAQNYAIEVDLLVTSGGKKADNPFVTVYLEGEKPERFEANAKGNVYFALEAGHEHRVVIEADNCLPKVLVFDTTDSKSKFDIYPCDVDLAVVNKRRRDAIEEGLPIGVIRWNRIKRKWGHDAEYTRQMQAKYRAAIVGHP